MIYVEKSKSNWTYGVILILLAATFSSISQIFWKVGTADSFIGVILLGIGLLISGVGAILMLVAFRFGEVSILQPMMSFGFALSIILGNVFFSESITVSKIIGILFIISGVIFLSYAGRKSEVK